MTLSPTLHRRFARLNNPGVSNGPDPPPRIEDTLTLGRGTIHDYEQLAHHHYKSGRPLSVLRVFTLHHHHPTPIQRFHDRVARVACNPCSDDSPPVPFTRQAGGVAPHGKASRGSEAITQNHSMTHAKASGGGKKFGGGKLPWAGGDSGMDSGVVGVLVESTPSLGSVMRDRALGDRYRRIARMKSGFRVLNEEIRAITRVVVHPQWRGLGLAVRLVRAALDDPQTPFTEAVAAMGSVNPFFEKAGMTPYPKPALEPDQRLITALDRVGIRPVDLGMLHQTHHRITTLPRARRDWVLTELQRWDQRTFTRPRDRFKPNKNPRKTSQENDQKDTQKDIQKNGLLLHQLRHAQQKLLANPVYYLHDNRAEIPVCERQVVDNLLLVRQALGRT